MPFLAASQKLYARTVSLEEISLMYAFEFWEGSGTLWSSRVLLCACMVPENAQLAFFLFPSQELDCRIQASSAICVFTKLSFGIVAGSSHVVLAQAVTQPAVA